MAKPTSQAIPSTRHHDKMDLVDTHLVCNGTDGLSLQFDVLLEVNSQQYTVGATII